MSTREPLGSYRLVTRLQRCSIVVSFVAVASVVANFVGLASTDAELSAL